jgi:hypothetical protein
MTEDTNDAPVKKQPLSRNQFATRELSQRAESERRRLYAPPVELNITGPDPDPANNWLR